MQIEIRLDPAMAEPKVVIFTREMTEEVHELARRLSEASPQLMLGFLNEQAVILDQTEIYRVFSLSGKIYAETDGGAYLLRARLYELEERLDKSRFVRISNAEIINLKKVKGFDLSLAGTICVRLSNGTVTYASRRYVARIKQVLGI